MRPLHKAGEYAVDRYGGSLDRAGFNEAPAQGRGILLR